LLLVHVTFWFVAIAGAIVAISCSVSPANSDVDDLFRVTPVTAIAVADTVTSQVALYPPSDVVAVIVVFPAAIPLINPEVTFATAVLSLAHVTLRLVAVAGAMVAVSCSVPPISIPVTVLFRATPVTDTLGIEFESFVPSPSVFGVGQPASSVITSKSAVNKKNIDLFISKFLLIIIKLQNFIKSASRLELSLKPMFYLVHLRKSNCFNKQK
jgi:hypothetical protein